MKLNGNWNYPTAIWFGAGRIAEIAAACRTVGMRKPLLVTDSHLATMSITSQALHFLEVDGLGRAIFSQVDSNPSDINVAVGLEIYRNGSYDGVVAFGGGSGLDLGKTLAFMARQTRPLWDFEDIAAWWMRANITAIDPIVAIPTTAGTGSEVGRAAIITNSTTREKKIIFHPKILPSVVICDPELTIDMPPSITAGTGLDSFAHCVEAFCSPYYHPMSQGIALEGMRLVKNFLPRAYAHNNDIEARSNMMAAAAMGATAFQKGLGAIHALSHPIGAMHNTHHGTTNAVCMPEVLQFNRQYCQDILTQAAAYLNIDGGFDGFCAYVNTLNDSLGIPKKLTGLGVENPDIEALTRSALNDPSAANNPRKMTYENTHALFEAII